MIPWKYQGDYHVIDYSITSLHSCTEEADLLIPTFQSDKNFSPNPIEEGVLYNTSARDKYIQFVRIFFEQSNHLPPKRYCVTKIVAHISVVLVPCSCTH